MNDEIQHTDVSISLLYSKLFNGPTIDLIPIHIPLLSISLEPIAIYQFIDTEPKKVDLSDLRKELFDDNPMFSSANDINKISDSSPPPFDIPKSPKMNEYVVQTTDSSPQNMETIFHTNYDINIYSFESIIAFQNSSISRTNIATSIQIISNFSPTQHQLMKRYLPSKENDHYHTFIHHHIDKWIHITFIRVPNSRTFISFAGHSEIHPQCDQRKATFIAFFEREAIIQLNLTFETTNWMNHYKLIIAIFRQNLKASIDGLCISYAKYYSSLDEPSLEKLEKDYEQIQLQTQYLWSLFSQALVCNYHIQTNEFWTNKLFPIPEDVLQYGIMKIPRIIRRSPYHINLLWNQGLSSNFHVNVKMSMIKTVPRLYHLSPLFKLSKFRVQSWTNDRVIRNKILEPNVSYMDIKYWIPIAIGALYYEYFGYQKDVREHKSDTELQETYEFINNCLQDIQSVETKHRTSFPEKMQWPNQQILPRIATSGISAPTWAHEEKESDRSTIIQQPESVVVSGKSA